MTDETQGVTWDLTSYFPEFGGPEMEEFKAGLYSDVAELRERAGELGTLSEENAAEWEAVFLKAEDLGVRGGHIMSYVGCLESADAANEAYSRERAGLTKLAAEFGKFEVEVLRALKEVDDETFDRFLAREGLAGAAHFIRRSRQEAKYTMSPSEERLATDLGVDGIQAWGRLYDRVSGKLEFEMDSDGKTERLPISQWRARMSDVDREKGRAAFEGGNRAWAGVEDVCAAALNAISGTRHTLYRYRGVEHFLDMALFQSSIEKKTLDAMYEGIRETLDLGREIFRAKAGFLGREGIEFFERESPLPLADTSTYTWEEGVAMVQGAFDQVYPALGDYYRGSMLGNRWIESEVRPGKRPGAFCTGSPLTREQRVYMTFNGSLGDVRTMAHEVGHALHGHVMKDMRPMAKHYPMTLAETASIFAEHILAEGIYSDDRIGDVQKLTMLDGELGGAAVMLLDITVRFTFEKRFYEERESGEVGVTRLKELMVEAQKEVFGDALQEDGVDPYFWASKLHFYIAGVSFYNFPYTFGFLLARALFNLFKKEGPSFLPRYEDFLRLTGSDTVENVAKRSIGADVSDPAFWVESIRSLEEPIALYRSLLEKQRPKA